jgi:hypothetical protein
MMANIERIKNADPADSFKTGADKINDSFESVNTELADQDSRIDNIIAQSGTSDTEVVDARVNARGDTFPVLKDRIDDIDVDLKERAVNVKWYGASGSDQTTTGSIDSGSNSLTVASVIDFEVGQGIAIDNAGPNSVKEVASLQITADATADGNVTVTLDGVSTDVAVLNGDTATVVADKIRNTTFTGWTTGGTAGTDTVTFTADTYGDKQDATYSAGTTGATGTMTTTTQGVNDRLVTEVTEIDTGTNTITLLDTAGTTVSDVNVQHDDSKALQDALNDAPDEGRKILVPPGVYVFADNIIPPAQSTDTTTIKPSSIVGLGGYVRNASLGSQKTGYSVFHFIGDGIFIDLKLGDESATDSYLSFEDIRIFGDNKAGTTGVKGHKIVDSQFKNVLFRNFDVGMEVTGSSYYCVFDRVLFFYNITTGLSMTGLVNGTMFQRCNFSNNSDGFNGSFLGHVVNFDGCWFEKNTKGAVLGDTRQANFNGCYWEDNETLNVSFDGFESPATEQSILNINGCYMSSPTTSSYAIRIIKDATINVIGCFLRFKSSDTNFVFHFDGGSYSGNGVFLNNEFIENVPTSLIVGLDNYIQIDKTVGYLVRGWQATFDEGIGVGNTLGGVSTVGNVVRKMEVFDSNGASLGFVPIYDAIT